MVFSSIDFLFFFLPIVLVFYYVLQWTTRGSYSFTNTLLFISSLLFYIKGEKGLVLVMLFSGTVDYFLGLYICKAYEKTGNENPELKQKMALVASIFVNLFVLFYFKYSNFFIEQVNTFLGFHVSYLNVTLPLGISFYTFQSMSYTIDIYYKNVKANRNYIDYNCYITMFPQLVAGPIVRYRDIQFQLRNRKHSFEQFEIGFTRFVIGLAKKVLIANFAAFYADEIFSLSEAGLNTPLAWIGAFCYSLQIYFDFSGYSDMAIGLGHLFGFEFPENFNYPYVAKSIQDFWRRWHISLSSWFRDYLYIPLGGNRGSKYKTYRNMFIVFILCGFWHGASFNFILWGAFHGLFLTIERAFHGKGKLFPSTVKHIYTLFFVMLGWIMFRAETLSDLKTYYIKMFIGDFSDLTYVKLILNEPKFILCAVLGIVFSTPLYKSLEKKSFPYKQLLKTCIFTILFIASCISLIGDDYNPFIYFRF